MSKQYVVTEQKDRSGWWTILVAAGLVAFWRLILVVVTVAILGYLVLLWWRWYHPRRSAKRKMKQIEEANAWMHAPTKLITEGLYVWGNPEHYLDNYDDGMREWV